MSFKGGYKKLLSVQLPSHSYTHMQYTRRIQQLRYSARMDGWALQFSRLCFRSWPGGWLCSRRIPRGGIGRVILRNPSIDLGLLPILYQKGK